MSRSLVLVMLVAAIAAGCASDRDAESPSETRASHAIGAVCDSLGFHLKRIGFAPLIAGDGDSCSVRGVLSLTEVTLEVDPLEELRDSLTASGWMEAYEFTADGPGTTSFRVGQDNRTCEIEGGAPAWIDDEEIRQSDEYSLTILCRNGR